MPVPTDPIVCALLAIVLWSFWISCVIRDAMTARREGPRRDTMPSLASGLDGLAHPPRQPVTPQSSGNSPTEES